MLLHKFLDTLILNSRCEDVGRWFRSHFVNKLRRWLIWKSGLAATNISENRRYQVKIVLFEFYYCFSVHFLRVSSLLIFCYKYFNVSSKCLPSQLLCQFVFTSFFQIFLPNIFLLHSSLLQQDMYNIQATGVGDSKSKIQISYNISFHSLSQAYILMR